MKKILTTLFAIIITSLVFAQTNGEIKVNGIVLDELNAPLAGIAIYIKDKPGGVTTNLEGAFSINAKVGDKLIASYLGYEKFEKLILKAEPKLEIKMKPDENIMDEVVVTAMGTNQRKVSVVGAITNVDVSQLQVPATSLTNMLGARVPGVITRRNSGEPGKNMSEFWIRGIGTFGANQGALVLIDGLEGNMNNIDPADIESFTVLKDASATAVYGVRGANGVVLVTTKRGSEDKINISARANVTLSYLARMPDYLDATGYANLANEANVVRGSKPLYDATELDIIKYGMDPDLYPNVNWRDEILNRMSVQQTYYISARGGGSLAKYFVSLGASNESSAYKQDKNSQYKARTGYQTYNYRANIDMKLTKSTSLYFGTDGYISVKSEPGMANTDALWDQQSRLTPLSIPTIYSTGELPAFKSGDGSYSPYIMLNHTGISKVNNNSNNLTLALKQDLSMLIKGLSIRAQGSSSQRIEERDTRYILPDMYYANSRDYLTGRLKLVKRYNKQSVQYSRSIYSEKRLHFEAAADYTTTIGEDHRISGLLYYYMNQTNWKNSWETPSSMNAIPKRYQGLSGRITYGFRNTYLMDLNFGYTGSENFEPGKQFGFFPAIAGGWVPSSYKFMKDNVKWVNFFKIRASYGLVGNDRITDQRFPYLTIINENAGAGWGSTSAGISESSVGANNLMWEKAKKFDVGLDTKLFGQAFELSVDYFREYRSGIFQPRAQIPDYIGLINSPFGNVGKMLNKGADGNISFSHKINKNMSFTVRANFSYAINHIIQWEETNPKYDYQLNGGWPYGIQRGLVSLGLFKDEMDVANSPIQTFGKYTAGDVKYKDVNGDGKINYDDSTPMAYSSTPRLMYGFGGEFNYKHFTFGVLFRGTGRTDFCHTGNAWGMGYIPFLDGPVGNVLAIAADQKNRWTPASYSGTKDTENPNARFPRLSYGNNQNNAQYSTFWMSDARYLRLQEINLSYKLIANSLKKIGISSIDLQLVGTDLYVWDNVELWDPEQATSNGRSYPIPARYTLQVYVNF